MLKSYLYSILFLITSLSGIAQRTNNGIVAREKSIKSSIEIPVGNPAASISPSAYIKCWPNSSFTFSNTSTNCPTNGNLFQRMEKWNLGNYWGLGRDSIIEWRTKQNPSSVTITYPSVGNYSVQLQDSSLCGIDTAYLSVTVANLPTANLIAPLGPNCQGAPITFTNTSSSGYLYKWNFGAGSGFVSKPFGNQSFTYTLPGTYSVSIIALVGGGGALCTDTEKVVITILPRPTANFSVSVNKGCDSIIGTVFKDLSLNAIHWNWNFGNLKTFSGVLPPTQDYQSAGIFISTLTVTDSNGCNHSFDLPITVYKKPIAAFTASNGCIYSPTPFYDNSTHAINDPIISWKWNFNAPLSNLTSTLQNPSPIYTIQNTYFVQLIVNTASCADTTYQSITIKDTPHINFSLTPISGCQSFSVSFSNFSTNANTFKWDFGNGNNSSQLDPREFFINNSSIDQTFNINLSAFNIDGCSSHSYSTVTVYANPTSSFSLTAIDGCSPFNAIFSNNSSGANQYKWSFGDFSSSTAAATTLSHTYYTNSVDAKTFKVGLTAISTKNCKDSSYASITVYPKPNFDYNLSVNSGCSPFSVKFQPIADAITYHWNFGDNSPSDTLHNPLHTFYNTSKADVTYSVELVASNQFKCLDTIYKSITVYKNPEAKCNITPSVGCSPLITTFNNTSIGGKNYQWKFGDNTTSSNIHATHTFTNESRLSDKTYSCTLITESADGCKDSVILPVKALFKPKANFEVDTPGCPSKLLTFTNTSIGASNYQWHLSALTSTNTSISQTFYNSTQSPITYTVQLEANSSDNCADKLLMPIVIHPTPQFSILSNIEKGCTPLKITFPSIDGIKSYQWKFGDGGSAYTEDITHSFYNSTSSTVIYTVHLIGSDKFGCSDTTSKTITVFEKPTALFTTNTTFVTALSTPIHCINQSIGAIEYVWDFGDYKSSTDINPSHIYQTEGEFQIYLIAKNTHGCKDTFLLSPNIISELKSSIDVPNAFTPNTVTTNGGLVDINDLSNDVFYPILKGIKDYELSIYSKWGELLFVSNNQNIGWDGYYKGKLCTQDVYIWKIIATDNEGEKMIKTGDVTLLK